MVLAHCLLGLNAAFSPLSHPFCFFSPLLNKKEAWGNWGNKRNPLCKSPHYLHNVLCQEYANEAYNLWVPASVSECSHNLQRDFFFSCSLSSLPFSLSLPSSLSAPPLSICLFSPSIIPKSAFKLGKQRQAFEAIVFSFKFERFCVSIPNCSI